MRVDGRDVMRKPHKHDTHVMIDERDGFELPVEIRLGGKVVTPIVREHNLKPHDRAMLIEAGFAFRRLER